MRKKLFLFVVLLMFIPFIPFHLSGAEAEEGTCGENVKYWIVGNSINFTKEDPYKDAYWGRNCGGVFGGNSAVTVVNVNVTIKAPVNSSSLFSSLYYVEEMKLSNLDVSNVTNMNYMFHLCSSLKSLDLSGWNTSNVTDMESMFEGCSSLTSLDLSGWNISSVAKMMRMFEDCSSLKTLNISGWNTSNVKSMTRMFYGCSSLTSLDVSGWDTSNVTHMSDIFYGCSLLTSLDVSGWDTSNVIYMDFMFYGCSSLTSLDVSRWDISNVTDISDMFSFCSSLKSLDISGWDTSNVTSMFITFKGCSSLKSLDVSGWVTSNVKYMDGMFNSCSSLKSLDVSGWDTSNVTFMPSMFYDCSSLTSLDVSGWDTSNVHDMDEMFYGCSSLTSLDLSGWDISNLDWKYSTESIYRMFSGCSSLHIITLGKNSVYNNIYKSLPGYKNTWSYTAQGADAVNPLALNTQMTGSGLFSAYDYTTMAGTWKIETVQTPTITSSPTYTPTITSMPTYTPTITSMPTYTPTITPSPTYTPTSTPSGPSVEVFSIYRYYENGTFEDVTKKTVEIDLVSGERLSLKAIAPDNAHPSITWKNSSAKTAGMSVSGDAAVVTGLKAGTAKITASYKDGKKTVSAAVTVKFLSKVQPGSLKISGPDTVAEKKTIKLAANFDQDPQPTNKKVTWTSENTGIAAVSSAGVVKGVKQGKTIIRLCSNENSAICASKEITVTPVTQKVEIIDLGDGSKSIDVNTLGTYQLGARALNSMGTTDGIKQEFTWKSSSAKAASVDQNGVVTACKAGKATITATANDGSKKSAKFVITVKSMVQDGSLVVEGPGNVATKKTIKLTASFSQKVQPTNKKVTWASENSSVAKVSSAGVVTGVSAGSTNIKVCSADRPSVCASHKVTVKNAAASVTITGPAKVGLDDKTAQLKAEILPQDAAQEVTWKSSAPKIASVDQDGVVKVYKAGTVTITATAADGSKKSGKIKLTVINGSTRGGELLADMPALEEMPDEIQNIQSENPAAEFVETIKTTQGNGDPELTETAEMTDPGEEYDPEEPADEENRKEKTEPHFASNETWMTAGESLILDVLDADGEAVIVGLDGDTDAVLWNEELRMLTAVGEAEVTAFLSTIDPVEVKDMIAIHIVSAMPEAEGVSEETGEAETAVTEDSEAAIVESEESAEGENTDTVTEPAEGNENIETVEPAEGEGPADAENESEDTADEEAAEVTESQEAEEGAEAEEIPSAEPVEISIRDLGEYDALSGEANGVVMIDRERFELDDETLSGLVFEIENESVAKLTEQSVEEMLVNGIEIQLLAEGETKLVIKQEGEDEPLREIRLVVTAAPVVEEEPAEEEVSEPVAEPVEEQKEAESVGETVADSLPEPEAEAAGEDIPAELPEAEEEPADE